jgi:predicted dehydrogenase
MTKPLKAAVIGTGNWGIVHIEAYWRSPEYELTAICGHSNRERLEGLGRRYGAKPYLNPREMIEAESPDIVSVILPDDQHYEGYKQVIEAGVNCLLEKPLAMDLDEARDLVALARRKNIFCAVNFSMRYATPFQLLKQHLDEKKLGALHCLNWRFTGGHYPERIATPLAHLLYMQCHGFNALRAFAGPIVDMVGFAHDPRGTGQRTTAALALRFESGAVGSFTASVDSDYGAPETLTLEILGSGGKAVITDTVKRFDYFPITGADGKRSLPTRWEAGFFEDEARNFTRPTDRHLAAIAKALRQGGPEPIPVEEGLTALEDGLRAIEAIEQGMRKQPKEDDNHAKAD